MPVKRAAWPELLTNEVELFARGTFNEALHRRLQAVVVCVPPLRKLGERR